MKDICKSAQYKKNLNDKENAPRNRPQTTSRSRQTVTAIALSVIFPAAFFFTGCDLLYLDFTGSGDGGTTTVSVKDHYSVTYDGNGNTAGTVPVDDDDYISGDYARIQLPGSTFGKTGYFFNGWTLAKDDTTTIYGSNDSLTVTGNVTLYAYWIVNTEPSLFTITYHTGTAAAGTVPVDITAYTASQNAYIAWNEGTLTLASKVFSSWNTTADGTGTDYEAGDSVVLTQDLDLYPLWSGSRSFQAYNFSTKREYTFNATPLAVTRHCIVYVDNEETGITVSDAEAVAAEYENNIYQMMRDNYGKPLDVDNNDALIILMFDIRDSATASSAYYAGYFNPGDMYSTTVNASSNEADMINMDIDPGFSADNQNAFYATIAHELQHLINFSVNYTAGVSSETWLNEGLSTSAEYLYAGEVEDERIDYYNNYGSNSIVYGNNFFVWDGYWENLGDNSDVLADYSTAYMFFQWLRIHASNRTGIYKEILESGYGDYRAVTTYAAARINSQFSSWPTLMRTWYTANLCNDAAGYYGYKGELGELTPWVVQPSGDWIGQYLYPGEGIIAINYIGEFTPSVTTAHMSYSGITKTATYATASLDISSPYTGTYTLAVNGNTSISGSKEAGYFPVANIISSARSLSGSIQTPEPAGTAPEAGSYPIDALLGVEGVVR